MLATLQLPIWKVQGASRATTCSAVARPVEARSENMGHQKMNPSREWRDPRSAPSFGAAQTSVQICEVECERRQEDHISRDERQVDPSRILTRLASVGFRDAENGPSLFEGAAHAWRPGNVLSPREELARGRLELAAAGGCGYSSAGTWRRVKHAEAISDAPPRRTPHAIRLTTNRRDSSIGK
jgi:hypothetical protein